MADEEVKIKSDPPHSKGRLFVERLNAYRNIILATAALAPAIGSWFKPTDTTATKNSFEWTSNKIEELAANDLRTKEDLVALRNFLEGYVQAQSQRTSATAATTLTPTPNSSESIGLGSSGTLGRGSSSAPTSAPRPTRRPRRLPEPVVAIAPESAPEPLLPLPEMKANPKAIKSPNFEQVAAD